MRDEKTRLTMDRRTFLIATSTTATAAWAGMGSGFAEVPQTASAAQASQSEMQGPSVERRMAQYAAEIRYADLPGEVVQACKRSLLDALACAFGAVDTAPARITEATFAKAFGAGGNASVVGFQQQLSAEGATLVNGTLIRQLEFNDIYFGTDPAHPSEIIAPAMACCEEAGRSGRDLIEAIVVGYEAEVRLNNAFSWASRGCIASTTAAFVTPLVAGKAWQMPVEQVVHAMGISGPRQLTALAVSSGEISTMKAVGPGYNAMDGVFSTRLAAAGLTGVTSPIEWLAANVGPKQASVNIDLDPGHYLITKVGSKRFPLEGDLQALAEAGVNLYAKVRSQAASIQKIDVGAYPATVGREVASPEKYNPESRGTADHSLPICLALTLLDGDLTVEQFDDERWRARDVIALAQKVRLGVSQSLITQMPNGQGVIVEVTMTSGQVFSSTVLVPEGDASKPLSRVSLEHKFRQFADPVIGEAGSNKVIDYVNHLEEVKDIRVFTESLRRKA